MTVTPPAAVARATAAVKGLTDKLELVDARADQAAFEKLNPLNKVPTLVTDAGEVLIESRLICEYIDSLAGGPQLYPKDPAARREALNAADVAILCLPDDAARDAVAMIDSNTTRVIDASTAHRVADGWAYGFPEM